MARNEASTRHQRFFGEFGGTEKPKVEFGKDYDHILYSSAFRRLGGVTQVVGANETALFHNRLTHSLKVAQVGRLIVSKLQEIQSSTSESAEAAKHAIAEYGGGLDPRVIHAACIAHDLGHPPFGHIAEEALQELLSGKPDVVDAPQGGSINLYPQTGAAGGGLADSFEGNAQSFRIVTKLAFRESHNDVSAALNLTKATLAALTKYPWSNNGRPEGVPPASQYRKWGYYDSEKRIFDWMKEGCIKERIVKTYAGDKKELRTIEAQVMDWADDISYAIHDVEDFFRAGLIPLDVLSSSDSHFDDFFKYAWPRVQKSFLPSTATDGQRQAKYEEVQRLLQDVRPFLPTSAYQGTRTDRETLHKFASRLIRNSMDSIRLTNDGLLMPGETSLAIIEVFKQLTWYYVIDRPSLSSAQHGQVYLIRELFRDLSSWVRRDYPKSGAVLPPRLREYVDIAFDPDPRIGSVDYVDDEMRVSRAVVDYIVSLTESQAIELAARLHGRTSRSILESWFHM